MYRGPTVCTGHPHKEWAVDFPSRRAVVGTVPKMDEFNKFPCGHISPSPCQTLRSNDIRMRFGLLIDPPIGPQFSDKVLVF